MGSSRGVSSILPNSRCDIFRASQAASVRATRSSVAPAVKPPTWSSLREPKGMAKTRR